MKKYETKIKNLKNTINNTSKELAWNVDKAFAEMLYPVIKQFKKDALKHIDFSQYGMYKYEKVLCIYLKNKKLYEYFHNKGKARFENKLSELEDCLNDICIEDTEEHRIKWKLKELLEVKYNHIPIKKPNVGLLYRMEIKPEYKENDIKNTKIIQYNLKILNKCYKWRKKCLHWFIDNLHILWW